MGNTNSSFQAMLNQYLPNDLLREEFVKRDWLLQNVTMENDWLGGSLIVPFKGSQASSVAFGQLTASSDIAEDQFVRGSIDVQPEAWGSLLFHQRDIFQHGKLNEQNFLKLLPDTVEDFLDYMKQVVSLNMLNGTSFAALTADGGSTGLVTVDRPERFVLGQKVYLLDNGTVGQSVAYYVTNIVTDTAVIQLATTRGGSTFPNLSTYTLANVTKVYFDGSIASGFTSLRGSLLSAANGGTSSLYGKSKLLFPYLQSINVSGASVNSSNILQQIFDAYTVIKNRGKGMPNKVVMSFRNLGYVMSVLESQKGSYHIDQTGTKVNAYGWTEIMITGVKGTLTVVGIQEANDDLIMFLDTRPTVMKIYSNGGFQKRKSPNGIEYFEVRNTTGFDYIIDVAFMADFVLQRPSYCGVLHSIP